MVIDMNESRLETIEQIREFLVGTAEVAFSIPADESTLRAFVTTVIRRFRYFSLSKGHRGVLFAYMRRLTGYSRQHLSRADRAISRHPVSQAVGSCQPHQLCSQI